MNRDIVGAYFSSVNGSEATLSRPERERLVQVFRDIDRWRQRLVADYFPGLG